MRFFLLLGFFVLLFTTSATAQKSNIQLSNSIYFDAEPYIAINPKNPNHIVAAWMGVDKLTVTIKTRTSYDGGNTWGTVQTLPHFGHLWHSADVSMAWDKTGILYICYIDYRQLPDSGGVFILKSTDEGLSFSYMGQVCYVGETSKKAIDRPWLTLANAHTLFVTTKPAPWIAAPNRPYLKFSIDSGKTWSNYRFIDSTNNLVGNTIKGPMATPAVNAGGILNMIYPSYLVSQSIYARYILAQSRNLGQSISYTNVLSLSSGINDTNYKVGYHLITHPKDSNKMAFVFVGKIYNDPDIFIVSTSDGGKTWSNPTRVNDDSINNGKGQDMVWASYDSLGHIWVTWRDRRLSPGIGFDNQGVDVYGALSKDNGLTFSKNIRLSDTTVLYDSIIKNPGNDFMCNALLGDTANTIWGDTRNGHLQVYFVKTSIKSALSLIKIISIENTPAFEYGVDAHNHKLIIKGPFDTNILDQVYIFDLKGCIINNTFTKGILPLQINLSNLLEGDYIVLIVGKDWKVSHKFYWKNQ